MPQTDADRSSFATGGGRAEFPETFTARAGMPAGA